MNESLTAIFDIECEYCHQPVLTGNLSNLFTWNFQIGYQPDSISCGKCEGSIRAKAPYIKPQPKRIPGVNFVDGWDV